MPLTHVIIVVVLHGQSVMMHSRPIGGCHTKGHHSLWQLWWYISRNVLLAI